MPIFIALFLITFATATVAHAYTDPGSGSLFLQLVFAALLGLVFRIRKVIGWIRSTLGREQSAGSPPSEPDD